MKKNLSSVGIVIFFFLMLLFPEAVFQGASKGLLLWYQIVLPTLFPFLLISTLLLKTGSIHIISDLFSKIVSLVFKVSSNASFVVITGFLCGYPVGAKMAADLAEKGYISKEEGEYLLSFCNNSSPGFIMNYIVLKTLKSVKMLLPTMLILMTTPVIVSIFTRTKYNYEAKHPKMKASKKAWNFTDLDFSIMDSFDILIKVGGYIMLFSIIIVLTEYFSGGNNIITCLLATLEITNGAQMLNHLDLSYEFRYILILALTAFGGWCSIAQTQCVIQKSGFRISRYIIEKLAASFTASFLGILYLFIINM